MLSTQTNIALQIVATLSEAEKATFAAEFAKLHKPTIKPKKEVKAKKYNISLMAAQYLENHRAKYRTPDESLKT